MDQLQTAVHAELLLVPGLLLALPPATSILLIAISLAGSFPGKPNPALLGSQLFASFMG